MRTILWVLLGWLGVVFWTAVGARLVAGHVLPDIAVITTVFLAFKREAVPLVAAALGLGYLVGRQALAPAGLHEVALATTAITVYAMGGNLVAGGTLFFASVCAAAAVGYHGMLFLLQSLFGAGVGFSSWWTASLLPGATATFAVAALSHPLMELVERRVSPDKREGLAWR